MPGAEVLTAGRLAGLEDFEDLIVHFDLVLFNCDPFITPVKPSLDPRMERQCATDRVDHVADVLPRELLALPLLRGQVLHDLTWSVLRPSHHVSDAKAFELGHVHVLDLRALDPLALGGHQLLHMVDGHHLIGRQVEVAIHGQQPVDLPFGLGLGSERLGADLLGLVGAGAIDAV